VISEAVSPWLTFDKAAANCGFEQRGQPNDATHGANFNAVI
jgi:hypothetical protein